jgi:tRNA pseudouridine38-40 synthase
VQRFKIIVEYLGSKFVGWQRQNNGISIQQLIEEAIFKFSQELVLVYGAGRTDKGVHALGQVAHFDLEKNVKSTSVMSAINFYLKPHPISILEVKVVPNNFHARFDAKQRRYVYKIINRIAPLAIMNNFAYHVAKPLNTNNMKLAAQCLIGKHDLSSFRSIGCQSNNPIKNIDSIDIAQYAENIEIAISAPSFLHNQVRIIVGTLVKIGKEEWEVEKMAEILAAKNRKQAGPTAPSAGLYLLEVKY